MQVLLALASAVVLGVCVATEVAEGKPFATSTSTSSASPSQSLPSQSPPTTVQQPNILYIMADDLNNDWKNNRLDYMPHLRQYFRDGGSHFVNHVAAQPVCGPSRSSMLLGRYPHSTGYRANDDLNSIQSFLSKHNSTVGKWLADAGYYTSFLGKYVNSCERHIPSGWSYWGGFQQTYNFYNATMWDVDWTVGSNPPLNTKIMTGVHQADFLVNETLGQVDKALDRKQPFFISVTPVMPHWGTCDGPHANKKMYSQLDPFWEMDGLNNDGSEYKLPISPCPTDRNRHAFDKQTNPHIDGVWNVSITGPRPDFIHTAFETNPHDVNDYVAYREDLGWRNRSAALLDLDDMLGGIMDGLYARELMKNTIVFFTSDNGYHLGEHKMPMGKGEPYDTDVRLPMYVTGPQLPKNVTMLHPTNHLDITATIVDLANANAHAPLLDGKSFASELRSVSTAMDTNLQGDRVFSGDNWRQFSFSEYFSDTNTWQLVRHVNSTHMYSYIYWCTNQSEVFDMTLDPFQTRNVVADPGLGPYVIATMGHSVTHLGNCVGASCWTLGPPSGPAGNGSLSCYPVIQARNPRIGSFSFKNFTNGTIFGVMGWAVDFNLQEKPGDPSSPRGYPPATVQLYANGAPIPEWPSSKATIPRPDIRSNPLIPNDAHGFTQSPIPPRLLKGKQEFSLRVLPGAREIVGKAQCLCDGVKCNC